MSKIKCNRCGAEVEHHSMLALFVPRKTHAGITNRSYEFDLCDKCAHDVFAFIGEQPDAKGSKRTPDCSNWSVQKQ